MGSYYFLTVTNIYFYSVLTLCQTLCYLLYELSDLIFKIILQYSIMFILPIVTEKKSDGLLLQLVNVFTHSFLILNSQKPVK